jgi:sterol 3beta-glucosyltransferase
MRQILNTLRPLSWFLDDADLDWKPSQELNDFINKARVDDKPLVYIGFGSIVVPNPKAMTRSIVKAVVKSEFSTRSVKIP